MSKEKTHIEKVAAEKKSIGFDHQYYFFLWKLLSIGIGESVGLEVKDDVHTELNDTEQVFYQIKHTVQHKPDGSAVNLTTSDKDLWKTLSNWAQIISDKTDGREKKSEQLTFIKKTSFVLASNKSSSEKNTILRSIVDLQEGNISIVDVMDIFCGLNNGSTDETLKEYIDKVLSLENDVLNNFMLSVFFELEEDDIICKCKEAIKADKIDTKKIDTVFSSLDSAIRIDNYIRVKNGDTIQISFDDFFLRYRRHYELSRNGSLSVNEFNGALPDTLESQTFIQQLLEIEDLQISDFELIAEFTRFKLKLQNNIAVWIQDGEITHDEINRFKKDAIHQWKNKHRSSFRGITEESEYNKLGLTVLDSMRERKLLIADQTLDTDMCNGTFYDLSDAPDIGWRKDWEKYKK